MAGNFVAGGAGMPRPSRILAFLVALLASLEDHNLAAAMQGAQHVDSIAVGFPSDHLPAGEAGPSRPAADFSETGRGHAVPGAERLSASHTISGGVGSAPPAQVTSTVDHSRRRRRTAPDSLTASLAQKMNCSDTLGEPCLPFQKLVEAPSSKSSIQEMTFTPSDALAEQPAQVGKGLGDEDPEGAVLESTAATLLNDSAENTKAHPLAEVMSGPGGYTDDYWDADGGNVVLSAMLPLELHLQGISLEGLLRGYGGSGGTKLSAISVSATAAYRSGSLADLLNDLHKQICQAAHINGSRLIINSIHGKFTRSQGESGLKKKEGHDLSAVEAADAKTLKPAGSMLAGSLLDRSQPGEDRIGEEVVVRFFLVPRRSSQEPSDRAVLASIRKAISDGHSDIRQGSLKNLLATASFTVGYEAVYDLASVQDDRLSALALPMGISAAFTGILIWLSAW